jgi:hypothetical protein
MAGLKGKSGPPGNMNAFKHRLTSIQKRREEGVITSKRNPKGALSFTNSGLTYIAGRYHHKDCLSLPLTCGSEVSLVCSANTKVSGFCLLIHSLHSSTPCCSACSLVSNKSPSIL